MYASNLFRVVAAGVVLLGSHGAFASRPYDLAGGHGQATSAVVAAPAPVAPTISFARQYHALTDPGYGLPALSPGMAAALLGMEKTLARLHGYTVVIGRHHGHRH